MFYIDSAETEIYMNKKGMVLGLLLLRFTYLLTPLERILWFYRFPPHSNSHIMFILRFSFTP